MVRVLPFLLMAVVSLSSCTTFSPERSALNSQREGHLAAQGYRSQAIRQQWGDQRYWAKAFVGKAPSKLLIDSGANSTDISKNFAARHQIASLENVTVVSKGALGRELTSGLTVTSLRLGTVTLPRFPLVVSEHREKKSAVSNYDGQLGLDALHHTFTLLDIAAKKLWTPQSAEGPPLDPSQLGFESLPLKTAQYYPHLILEGKLKGRTMRWILDSGAEVSLIDLSVARSLGLNIVGTQSKMIDVAGDSSPLSFVSIARQEFGTLLVRDMTCAVAPLDVIRRSFKLKGNIKVDGILGVDFLRSTRALLDVRQRRIYLGHPEERQRNQNTP